MLLGRVWGQMVHLVGVRPVLRPFSQVTVATEEGLVYGVSGFLSLSLSAL